MNKSKLVRFEAIVRFGSRVRIAFAAAFLLIILISMFVSPAVSLVILAVALLVVTGAVIVVAEFSRAILRCLINKAR